MQQTRGMLRTDDTATEAPVNQEIIERGSGQIAGTETRFSQYRSFGA